MAKYHYVLPYQHCMGRMIVVLLHCAIFVDDAESPLMRDEKQPLGGAVVVTVDSGTAGRLDVEVLWAHTTDSMCLGYMSTTDQQAKVTTAV